MQVLNVSTVVQLSSSCFTECKTMPEYHVCIYVYTVPSVYVYNIYNIRIYIYIYIYIYIQ